MQKNLGFHFVELLVGLVLVLGFLSVGLYYLPRSPAPSISKEIRKETQALQNKVNVIAKAALQQEKHLGRKYLDVDGHRILLADGYPVAVIANSTADNAGFQAFWSTELRAFTVTERPGNVPYRFVYGLPSHLSVESVLRSRCYIDVKTHISYPFRPNRLVDYRLSILSETQGCSS